MKLTRIRIDRSPGIVGGFEATSIGGGLNVVLGPNGSGKSSMCRAIRLLLFGGASTESERRVACVGTWSGVDGDVLTGELEMGRSVWRRDGVIVPGPTCPAAHLASCHVIAVVDLMDAAGEGPLASVLLREMMAGVDLHAVQSTMQRSSMIGRHQRRGLNGALDRLASAQRDAGQVQASLERLPELERRRDEARAASAMATRLAHQLEWCDAVEAQTLARTRLDAFPSAMASVRGDELERLTALESRRSDLLHRMTETERAAAEARAVLDGAGARTSMDVLDASRRRVGALGRLEAELDELARGAEPARQSMERCGRVLGEAGVASLSAMDVTAASVHFESVEDALREREAVVASLSALEAEIAALSGDGEGASAARESDIEVMRRWLVMADADERRLIMPIVASVCLGVAAVIGGLAGWRGAWPSVTEMVLLGVLAGCGVAVGMAWWVGRRSMRAARDAADASVVASADLEGVPTRGEVAAALELACRDVARGHARAARLEQRHRLESRVERQRGVLAGSEEKLRAACDAIGLRGSTWADSTVLSLASNWLAWQRASAAYAARVDEMDVIRGRAAEIRDRLAQVLGPDQRDADLASMESRLGALEVEERGYVDARRRLDDATSRLAELRADRDACEAQCAALFAEVGIEPDGAVLSGLIEALPAYRDAARVSADADAVASAMEARVRAEGDVDPDALDPSTIRMALDEARDLASLSESIIDEIKSIEHEARAAEASCAVAGALTDVELAEDALASVHDDALFAAAGRFMLERVESAHRLEHQPAVVREAGRLFGLFTAGRYSLLTPRVGEGGETFFVVRDLTTGDAQSVDALSTGTRAQLLLSVRLAFVRMTEGSVMLPIFIDEALNSSDPDRFEAVVRGLQCVAAEGRQIFYLTCRPGDWLDIERIASSEGGAAHLIDLGRVRAMESSRWLDDAFTALQARTSMRYAPEPEAGETAISYARRVGAEPLDPRLPVEHVHVVHLVPEDPGVVHRLLVHGIVRLGQIARLRDEDESRIVGPGDVAMLAARASVFRAVWRAWSVGRGRPLEREALERGGISSRFEPEVWDLATSVARDGRALVDGLRAGRVARLQQRVIDRLEASLISEGFIDPRPVLDDAAVRLAVARDVEGMDTMDAQHVVDRLLGAFRATESATAPEFVG